MATVSDLLHVQTFVFQLLGKGVEQPTVSEISDQAEAHTLLTFLVELGRAADLDVSLLHNLASSDRAESLSHALGSAANAIDPPRKYGFDYDANLGLLTLAWWIVDQVPASARAVNLGF